jgi:hypothetical protein
MFMLSLDTIFAKYNTDKNKFHHNYSRQYDDLFLKYRSNPIKYLEIGVWEGESLKAMREVFPNATHIVGVDVNPDCKKYEDLSNNIFVEIGDATSPQFVQYLLNKYGSFDIVLDDGSHINKEVIRSFELLFPSLNDNSLYVVEDTNCYKLDNHQVPGFDNQLVYFFKFTNFLNQWRFDSHVGIRDACSDPFKILKKTNNILEASIDKIEYGCSYIAIHKKIRHHWLS